MRPSLDEIKAIAAADSSYRKVPVSMELYADFTTPIEAMRILKNISGHCYMLESMEDNKNRGRYTFLGYDPILEITCTDGLLNIKSGTSFQTETSHPEEYIRKIITENKSPRIIGLPPFTGGLVGYFSYDYIKYSEPSLNLDTVNLDGYKDVDLMLFDKVIAFDNLHEKIILIVNVSIDNIDTEYNKACMQLKMMADLLRNGEKAVIAPGHLKSEFKAGFSREKYCSMVEKARDYIREGDIFQVVLSNRIEADYEGSLFDTYRVLRATNPSPYMFYFSSDDIEIAGASPETLVKLDQGILNTFPLAGTRPRGKNAQEDAGLRKELLADEKECSEHNMLVDLGRNDIGRISEFGSVYVKSYMDVLMYSHVMHIGSTVEGKIRKDMDALDAIGAVLPAGTLSGASKIRACEIISELEQNRRGIYGGAIGYIDFTGNLDTCIAIRICFKKNNKVFIRSGAGIVADSIPEKEHQECLNKAKAVIRALEIADGGLDR
ncbi:MAG: anthranilate synthase component I family protein [Lachnospiraceae bacterium]|nr:anthranilate synthase component I family protein [Lachnospiraceae bacterium]